MTMITRISKLIKADIHGVLDQLEDAETVLKYAIREMAGHIERDEIHANVLVGDIAASQKKLEDLDIKKSRLSEQLSICFENQKEELAKKTLKKILELEKIHTSMQKNLDCQITALSTLNSELDEKRERLNAIQEKSEIICDRNFDNLSDHTSCELSISDDDVEIAYIRELTKRKITTNSLENSKSDKKGGPSEKQ